jgi:hypothetical protein
MNALTAFLLGAAILRPKRLLRQWSDARRHRHSRQFALQEGELLLALPRRPSAAVAYPGALVTAGLSPAVKGDPVAPG